MAHVEPSSCTRDQCRRSAGSLIHKQKLKKPPSKAAAPAAADQPLCGCERPCGHEPSIWSPARLLHPLISACSFHTGSQLPKMAVWKLLTQCVRTASWQLRGAGWRGHGRRLGMAQRPHYSSLRHHSYALVVVDATSINPNFWLPRPPPEHVQIAERRRSAERRCGGRVAAGTAIPGALA